MTLTSVLLWAGCIGLSVTALVTIVRIIRGPTILDRMIASDMLLTTLLLAVGVDMIVRNHTDGIVIMIAIAAVGTLATIVVALYVRRRADDDQGVSPGVTPNQGGGRRD